MRLFYSLLLSLFLSVSYGQGVLRITAFTDKEYTAPTLSAPSFASGGDFTTGREYYIYKLRGYDQAAAGSLPLMIFWGGYGMRDGPTGGQDWDNRVNEGEGLYYYLNNGSWDDLTYDHIVVVAQYDETEGDPTDVQFQAILTELTAEGVKYDPNRISITALSGGAIGINNTIQSKYAQIASVVTVSGPGITSGWGANYFGIGVKQYHGTADATFGRTIGTTHYWANGGFGAWIEETPSVRSSYIYGGTHSSGVWNNYVYNPAVATENFFQFCAKFSKDAEQQATLFTDNAEATLDIVDYREAKQQVDNLSSGAPKTALLSRLATLLTTVNQSGTRYYISPQSSGLGSLNTGYNIWSSFATGNGITNIVDVGNGASTIDITMTQECAASSRDANASDGNAGKQKSFGFDDYRINLQGFVVNNAVNDGQITISQIPTGKLVDIFIYHHHVAANDDDVAMSANNRLEVVCNSVTKSQYSAYNNYLSISFTDVPETSGNITLDFDAIDSRDCLVTGIELLVHD